MPTPARPVVDVLSGLTTAIVVDQEPMGSTARSTVGAATDVGALLRILFSRLGDPQIGPPNAFSFNIASASGAGALSKADGTKERREFSILGGQCPGCEDRGTVSDFDLTALFDASKSLSEGALTVPGYTMDGWYGRMFSGSGYFDMDKPLGDFTAAELDDLLYREATKIKVDGINVTYVFDEPTVGLHPHDIARMNELLVRLRDKCNTVLVVEHKPETIAIADHVVDVSPGVGSAGGGSSSRATSTACAPPTPSPVATSTTAPS